MNESEQTKRLLMAWEMWGKAEHAERVQATEYLKDFARDTIRILFLLNGGAAAALLALIGSLFAKGDGSIAALAISVLSPAFVWFAGGLVATAVMSGLGYANFAASEHLGLSPAQVFDLVAASKIPMDPLIPRLERLRSATAWVGAIVGAVAATCFAVGCITVAGAFTEIARVSGHPYSTTTPKVQPQTR